MSAPAQDAEKDSEERPAPADPVIEPASLFLERTHFGVRLGFMRSASPDAANRNILFEGSPALHLFVFNSLNDATLKLLDGSSWLDHLAVSLTFNPEVRMLTGESAPVRSPSWRVRLNVQGFWQAGDVGAAYAARITGVRLSLGHYSNGQEHCSFERGVLVADAPDPGCEAYPATQDVSLVNRDNGDFSLHHLTFAVHRRWVHLRRSGEDKKGNQDFEEHRSHTAGVVTDFFVGDYIPGGMSPALARLHGDYRVRGEYRYERAFRTFLWPRLRVANRLAIEAYGELAGGILRRNAELLTQRRAGFEAALTFPAINDLGLFVSFFTGNDYYNLLFVDRVRYQVLVGLVGETYGRPHYRDHASPTAQ